MTNGTGITILPLQLSVGDFEDSPRQGDRPVGGNTLILAATAPSCRGIGRRG